MTFEVSQKVFVFIFYLRSLTELGVFSNCSSLPWTFRSPHLPSILFTLCNESLFKKQILTVYYPPKLAYKSPKKPLQGTSF